MDQSRGKSLSQNLNKKYGQKFPDAAKNSNQCSYDWLKKDDPKTAKATGNLIENKNPEKITNAGLKCTHENVKISTHIPEQISTSKEICVPPKK